MKSFLAIGILFFVLKAFSLNQEQVLFLEVRNAKGEIIQLEPDFPYAHVLVSVQGKWVHSHPKTGVQFIENKQIEKFGEPREVFEWDLSQGAVKKLKAWVGLPYDRDFHWSDEKFYCSELVAKMLGVSPEPMHFDPKLWPPSFQELEGLPGVSPSKIYRFLKSGGFSF